VEIGKRNGKRRGREMGRDDFANTKKNAPCEMRGRFVRGDMGGRSNAQGFVVKVIGPIEICGSAGLEAEDVGKIGEIGCLDLHIEVSGEKLVGIVDPRHDPPFDPGTANDAVVRPGAGGGNVGVGYAVRAPTDG